MNDETFIFRLTSACRIPQTAVVFPLPDEGAAIITRGRTLSSRAP